ncbi:MAG TPA: PH domain-containing protein [Ferruginibacter sp.]|nr:PH domain-containing protein [Ferruginibacter sp.]
MRTSLKQDENILLIIRHHWLKLVMPFLIWIIVSVLSAIFFTASTALVIILIVAVYPLIAYFIWVHNIWAVTNLRVIDEGGFFTRYAKESPLDKINNIEYEQSFWGRVFGFGNVDIQTAAEMGETSYQMIHHPKKLKDTITHAQESYKKMQVSHQTQQLAKAIADQSRTTGVSTTLVADELHKLFELLQKGAISQEEYISQKRKLLGE